MIEIVFYKSEFCYQTPIDLGGDTAMIELDSGSPITTISVPNLLQITGESLYAFRKKVELFTHNHEPVSLGVYGSQVNEVSHDFLPYLVKDLKIGNAQFPFFMFWVDITHLNSKNMMPTSILFGYDYIKQGKKHFDEDDNFHIIFDSIKADTFSVEYAMSNINEQINEIHSLVTIT